MAIEFGVCSDCKYLSDPSCKRIKLVPERDEVKTDAAYVSDLFENAAWLIIHKPDEFGCALFEKKKYK